MARTVEIRSGAAKAGLVMLLYMIALVSGLLLGLAGGFVEAGWLVASAIVVVGVYGLTRVFRGEDEPEGVRRPWWRLTAYPLAGFVLALLFAAQAITVGLSPSSSLAGIGWIAVALNLLIAIGMLNSSLRLLVARSVGVLR